MAGAHNIGDLGVVAHAEGGVAEVLLDATDATVHVLVNNLVETAQERSTIEALGRYRTNDLVQLRDDSVGMVIRLSADTAHLLMPGVISKSVRTRKIGSCLIAAVCCCLLQYEGCSRTCGIHDTE